MGGRRGKERSVKTYLEIEEVNRLEDAATNLRDRLLIRLLFHLGCRISEVLGILATDIADSVLKKAVVGSYDKANVTKMPSKLINNYFNKGSDGSYTVKQIVKRIVTFKKLNLPTPRMPLGTWLHYIEPNVLLFSKLFCSQSILG